MTTTPAPRRPRYEALSSFRGIAAILIATFHFPIIFLGAETALVRHAYILTNLFFALSGFILMAAYGQRLTTLPAYTSFAKKRFWRLYPSYVLSTIGVLLVPFVAYAFNLLWTWLFTGKYAGGFSYPPVPLKNLLIDMFMLQGFGLTGSLHLNYPAWSMGTLFYCGLLFGGLSLFPKIRLPAFVACFAISFYVIATKAPAYMGSSYDFGIFRTGASFFSGVLTWYLWNYWNPQDFVKKWAVLFQSMALIGAVAFITWVGVTNPKTLWAVPVWSLFMLAFAIDSGDIVSALNSPRLKWLADRSFAIFLTHAMPIFLGIQAKDWLDYFKVPGALSSLLGVFILVGYLAVVLWLADLFYRKIEGPLSDRMSPSGK
jgi:peptidoglycan/LPS O-acetylase OafA/YrhL